MRIGRGIPSRLGSPQPASSERRAHLARRRPRAGIGAGGVGECQQLVGRRKELLAQAAQFYDGDIEQFLERFTRAFEPLLMAVIGAVVGLIVILLYMPIFDLAGGLS